MKQIKQYNLEQLPFWKIVIVATSDPAYEMDRVIVVENHPEWDDYTVITAGHCSCYDFDEVEWDGTICDAAELRKLADGWTEHGYGAERIIAPLILRYLWNE